MYSQKKAAFNRMVEDGMLAAPANMVHTQKLPTGAMCGVELLEDTAIIRNGRITLINNELSELMHMCGVSGNIIVHHTKINYGIPKWLTYKIHNEPFNEWKDDLIIYTVDEPKHPHMLEDNKFGVKVMHLKSEYVDIDKINDLNVEYSSSRYYDGLLIRCSTVYGKLVEFHILPQRYTQGRVVDYDNDWIVAELDVEDTDKKYMARIPALSNAVKEYINERERDDVIGRILKVQYTSFMPGDRVENFSSPVALFIINQS